MKRMTIFVLVAIVLGIPFYFLNTRSGQDLALSRLLAAALPAPRVPFDGLAVFMCGTSSPLPAPDRVQACVAISAGERLYVVDAGAGSARIATLGALPLDQLRAVLLTHFHSDHIAAIPDFNLNSWVAGRPQPLEIIGPAGVGRVVQGLNIAYAHDRSYRVAHHGAELLPPPLGVLHAREVAPGVILEEDGLTITAFAVDHSPVEPAFGYRFDYRGRSVVVSGDSIVTDTLRDAARSADLLLHDAISLPIVQSLERAAAAAGAQRQATVLKDIQDYHAPAAELGALARDAGVRQLAVYHLVPPPRNLLLERIFERDLPDDAIVTEDGMRFDLPADSEAIEVH